VGGIVLKLGYKVSSEEHAPADLVRYARRAEEVGFSFVGISDHYHPWIDRQGHSPFVWSVIGAIAHATKNLEVVTGVTCPTIRIHPAVIAHAAATSAALLPGRFSFGVGSGENLNEHILGDHWPPVAVRLEMLEEAVEVIRKLWRGRLTSHRGRYYTVENARIYDVPESLPPILVAGSGPKAISLAGRIGDGFIGLAPTSEMIEQFEEAGGRGKPTYSEVTVCWAEDEAAAKKTVMEWWPNAGVQGQLMQELALPSHIEQAASTVDEEAATKHLPCGPDADEHIEVIRKFDKAGYDNIWVHQIGPDQEGFFNFYERNVLPKL
jgi:coenzyme F420-dependent glucose-6-phosphate dehydrogenase